MASTEELHRAIAAVAPIEGVTIGRRDDKATWSIQFRDIATAPQRQSAQNVLNNFDINAPEDTTYSDQEKLNAALTLQGSVVRALGLIMFEEINKLRALAGQQQYTLQQFQTALLAKMRG